MCCNHTCPSQFLNEGKNEVKGSFSLEGKDTLPSPREGSRTSYPGLGCDAGASQGTAGTERGPPETRMTLGWATGKAGGSHLAPVSSLWERLEGCPSPLSSPRALKEQRELTPRPSCQQWPVPQPRLWLKIQRRRSVDQRCLPSK